jgi:replication factor C small subunit
MILKKEKIQSDDKGIIEITEYAEGDLRHAINLLQAVASTGNISQTSVKATAGLAKTNDVSDVLKLAISGKIQDARNKMIELIKVYGMSESDFLKYINQALFGLKPENLEGISQIIAKYDYRILSGANPEIQLTAMLAELTNIPKIK